MSGEEADSNALERDLTTSEVAEAAGVTTACIRGLAYEAGTTPKSGKTLPGRKVAGGWQLEFARAKAYAGRSRGANPKMPIEEILRRPQERMGSARKPKRDAEIAELKAQRERVEAKIKSWQDAWAHQRQLAVDRRRKADEARSQATHHLAGLLTAMQAADDNRLGEIDDLEDQLAEGLMPTGPESLS